MSAFRGILTGFGMAAIKDKEAKDNAKMEVVKAAGLDVSMPFNAASFIN